MFDDLIPEEREPAYNPLLTTLRSAARRQEPITAEEQAQIVTRVQERLAQTTSTTPLSGAAFMHRNEAGAGLAAAQTPKPRRLVYGLLVAVVVIGLIAGSWALYRTYPSSNKTPVVTQTSEKGPVAQAQVGGLTVSIHVLIDGPYFLSELLPVDVSLTNHTSKPIGLEGIRNTANLCFSSALMVQLTGGSKPSYTFPRIDIACTLPLLMTQVKAGQTLTIHQYVPLTKSGDVTLTMTLGFPNGTPIGYIMPLTKSGAVTLTLASTFLGRIAGPLAGHWPSVHIQVSAQIPPDRALSLQNEPGQVRIIVPSGAKANLLVMQSLTCENFMGSYGQWTTNSTTILHEPKSFIQGLWQTCPARHLHWQYIVSAPGYAIVSGNQTN